ncbi:uncharacterized protein BDFB_002722, partial [Asbolus verrucosus]
MLTKPSDSMAYARDLQEYFSVLGYLILCLHDENLGKLVLNAIICLLERQSRVGYCCVSLDCINEAAEKSRLPEILAQLLQVVSDDLYPLLLDATFLICEISTFAFLTVEFQKAQLNISYKDLNRLGGKEAAKLNPAVQEQKASFLISKIRAVFCGSYYMQSLQYALRWSTVCSGHQVDRNNLAGIILKLLDIFPTMEFVESELANDIAILAASIGGCLCNESIRYTFDDLDFQFKKIIWACLHYFKQFGADKIIKQNRIITSFTNFLFKGQTQTRDQQQQHCELTKIALRLIPKYLSGATDRFLRLQGPFKTIGKVKEYLETTYDIEVLEAFLYCSYEMLSLHIDQLITEFAVCSKILTNGTLTQIHQKCIARGFCILQILSTAGYIKDDVIVDLCIRYLNRIIRPNENDPVLDVKTTVCALHLLWDNLSSINSAHRRFLQKGGIYVMLDITECCTFPLKSLSLGVLADISKKPSCVPYLITWRKHGRKLVPMLMEIFRGQIELERESSERIQLFSETNYNTWIALCQGQTTTFQNCCISKTEILESCRFKIHGILHALKVKFKDRVYIANEHYKLYTEKLNTDDELTMLFARNFVSLTMCKSWMAVTKDLESDEIIPVDDDNELIADRVHRIHEWKSYLKYKVEQIVRNEMQNEQLQEIETYIALNEARLSDALDALTELRFVSKCTERIFQMTQKLRLSQDLDMIRFRNTNYHRTTTDLPFTNIYNQIVNIQSNVVYDKKEEVFDLAPVSPNENESLEISDPRDDLKRIDYMKLVQF